MPTTIGSLAEELFTDMGSPDEICASSIESWLINNIGLLNTTFGTNITTDATLGTFDPELTDALKVGYKMLYEIYYLSYSSKLALAGSLGGAVEVTTDDSTVRLVNRAEIIKVYKDLIKDLRAALRDLINYYRNDNHTVKTVRFADGFYEVLTTRVAYFVRSL